MFDKIDTEQALGLVIATMFGMVEWAFYQRKNEGGKGGYIANWKRKR